MYTSFLRISLARKTTQACAASDLACLVAGGSGGAKLLGQSSSALRCSSAHCKVSDNRATRQHKVRCLHQSARHGVAVLVLAGLQVRCGL